MRAGRRFLSDHPLSRIFVFVFVLLFLLILSLFCCFWACFCYFCLWFYWNPLSTKGRKNKNRHPVWCSYAIPNDREGTPRRDIRSSLPCIWNRTFQVDNLVYLPNNLERPISNARKTRTNISTGSPLSIVRDRIRTPDRVSVLVLSSFCGKRISVESKTKITKTSPKTTKQAQNQQKQQNKDKNKDSRKRMVRQEPTPCSHTDGTIGLIL
jgi:hypothetical protein